MRNFAAVIVNSSSTALVAELQMHQTRGRKTGYQSNNVAILNCCLKFMHWKLLLGQCICMRVI